VRYQAALRPDFIASTILNYFREGHHRSGSNLRAIQLDLATSAMISAAE
jgi:hypothetical protein